MGSLTDLHTPRSPQSPRTTRQTSGWLLGSLCLLLLACDEDRPRPLPVVSSATPQSGQPSLPAELSQAEAEAGPEAEPEPEAPPHEGPWLVVTKSSAGLYQQPKFDKDAKVGYARSGGRLPVLAEPVSKEACSSGWYQIVGGGFVCGNSGTTDQSSSATKFAQRPPDLDSVLPYTYARNAKNGTPLYSSIPSREQMHEYEPYLESAKKEKEAQQAKEAETKTLAAAKRSQSDAEPASARVDVKTAASERAPGPADPGTIRVANRDGVLRPDAETTLLNGGEAGQEQEEQPDVPWWQAEDAKDRLHEVTLEKLHDDADDVLARRMVVGFYVAIDKTFSWHGRSWYKTTKGLIAPSERFWQTKGSEFKGVELGSEYSLPLGWVYGVRKNTATYRIDEEANTILPEGSIERHGLVQLTGETKTYRGTNYHETKAGLWVKSRFLRVTEPGDLPEDLKPGERWIDVDLSQQTLVAFDGETPKYATLVSTGKKSSIKAKDHRTPTGSWRIYVKHVTATMDGDGTAAGDLPYSIEDVPYVMYYHKSYALHAAFWHQNYGVEMSHGCINLAPLDAKHLFFFAGPALIPGSHGAWPSEQLPGSIVQVHD